MENERTDTVEVPVDFLTLLLNYRREYFILCEEFKIPDQRRSEKGIAVAIIERVHTYLTSYVARKSIAERENGAAFRASPPVVVQDPVVSGSDS